MAVPGDHCVALDGAVGVLAAHAGLGQCEQHALRVDEAAEGLQIVPHALGVDDEPVDKSGQPGQCEIERDRRVRRDDALDRGMGNIALVP